MRGSRGRFGFLFRTLVQALGAGRGGRCCAWGLTRARGRSSGREDGWRFVDAEAEQIELCGVVCLDARLAGAVTIEYRCPSAG